MKKILLTALFVLFMLAAFSLSALSEIEIRGLEDGQTYLANQYLDVSVYVNGDKTECEWTFSPDYAARFSSGKKIRLMDIEKACEVAVTAYHEKSGSVKTLNILVVPQANKISVLHNDEIVNDGYVFLDMMSGKTGIQLSSSTSPSGANAGIVWTSSDETIAEVDQNGYVSFRAMGKCTITAETVNGRKASVTVSASFAAKTLDVIAPVEIAVGEKATLFAVISPDEAAQDGVTWKSLKEKVISVSETGEITAHRLGKAVITATANSGIQREVTIETYVPVETVQIRNSFSLKAGETEQLIVRVLPKEAKYRSVTFVSLNPEIATVDKDGFVTGVAPGSVTIIVSASNGVSAHISLDIRPVKLEDLKLSDHFATLKVGESTEIMPVFEPVNATERGITYITSNPDVAVADENGIVTAVGEGKCIIYCQSERSDIAPLPFRVNVQKENALPLEGLIIGLNPGHQEKSNSQKLPLAPGSSKTGNANNSGARGVKTKIPEYVGTLQISMYLKEELEKLGAQVVMTRTTNDVDINNIERAQMLNAAGVDIALQVHLNASDKKTQQGFSVYAKYSDFESQAIGQIILENACRVSGAKMLKVVASNNYMSLNWTETPTVLIECGYLSNAEEDVKLNSPVYQKLLAQGISEGLVEYFTGSPIQ